MNSKQSLSVVQTKIAAVCLLILTDQVEAGLLEHIIISKILHKKYTRLFSKLEIDNELSKVYIKFLGAARVQLEEFDLEKGRVYRFIDGETLTDQDALLVFSEVNAIFDQLTALTDSKMLKRGCEEISKRGDGQMSLISYMLA